MDRSSLGAGWSMATLWGEHAFSRKYVITFLNHLADSSEFSTFALIGKGYA